MLFNRFFTVIHFEMEEINCPTDNETIYAKTTQYIYMFDEFGILWSDVTLWRNTIKKIFDWVFALERTWPLTRADWPLTPRQQVLNALRFYTRKTFEQVIGDLFGVSVLFCCMHSRSQGFKSYRCVSWKKRTFPVIPWELGWFKEMVFIMLRTFQLWSGPSSVLM